MTFFDTYSYRQKKYALLLLGVLLLAVCYKRSFKETLDLIQVKNELETKNIQAKTVVNDIYLIRKTISNLNKLIGKENVTVEKVQQGFLNFFALNANQLSVYQIDEVLSYEHPDFRILTHKIIIKGGFNASIDFLYKLEKQFDLAKVLNVTFNFIKINSSENEALYTELLLQNYESR